MDLTGLTRMSVEPPGDSTVYRQLVDAMILGKAMIVVGILTLCCAVTEMCFFDQLGWLPLEGGWVDYWTAILCVVTGVVAFLTGRNMHRLLVRACLCLSVLTAVVSLQMFIRSIRRAVFFGNGTQSHSLCHWNNVNTEACPGLIFNLIVTSVCTVPLSAIAFVLAIRGLLVCGRTIIFVISPVVSSTTTHSAPSSAMSSVDIQS